jgi:streptogramin lyase
MRYANLMALNMAMDFGFGTGDAFSLVFDNVPFGSVGSGQGVDALGYLPSAPISSATAVARFAAGTADIAKLPDVNLASGDVATFYSNGAFGFLILCRDNAPPKGLLSDCVSQLPVVPPPADAGTPAPDAGDTSGSVVEYPIPGGTSDPSDIVLGPDGALWFTEFQPVIGRITTDGSLTEFPLPSKENPGGFRSYATGISVGPDGALWFGFLDRIGRITVDGTVTTFPTAAHATTAGPDGNVWFTRGSGIGRITPAGDVTLFDVPDATDTFYITSGPDQNLWFTDFSGNKIGRMTPTGEVTTFPLSGIQKYPRRIVAGPDGNLWFTEFYGIGRVTPDGVITQFGFGLDVGGNPLNSDGLTVRQGAIWFTSGHEILWITSPGVYQAYPLAVPFTADGIAASPNGRLWFTDSATEAIGRFIP